MQETKLTEKTNVQPIWLTVLRFVLGLILLWKGIVFIRDSSLLQQLIEQTGLGIFSKYSETFAFIVAYFTLMSGLFIGTGLFTRIVSILQIPILIIALFFVNINRIETSPFELILSLVTFVLLILFAFKGSSRLSADQYFRSYYKIGSEKGRTEKAL